MRMDKGWGRRVWASAKRIDDDEHGGPTKSLDDGQREWMRLRRKMRTENSSMDIVRAAAGVSNSR